MIEILTLFLSLVTGPQPVDLAVGDPVERIELWLDGRVVEELTEPPWRVNVDLGPELLAHELEAVAFDRAGLELDRATLWVNVEMPAGDASLRLIQGADGHPEAVEIVWEGVGRQRVRAAEVRLDDLSLAPLAPTPGGFRALLPILDLSMPHLLTVTLHRIDAETLRRTVVFGGAAGLELETELTAVPIQLDPGARLPEAAAMQGWFLADGEPLRVHGVEKGSAEILLVRDPSLQAWIDRRADEAVERAVRRGGREARGPRPEPFDSAAFFADSRRAQHLATRPDPRLGERLEGLRTAAALGGDTVLRVVTTRAAPVIPGGLRPELFTHSGPYPAEQGGLLFRTRRPAKTFPDQSSDATALAGMLAHTSQHRRAVVLLRHPFDPPFDASAHPAAEVRRYLATLGVPLLVWELHDPGLFGDGPPDEASAYPPYPPFWPPTHRLGVKRAPLSDLEQALAELRKQLDRQRIVWLEGRHLPGTVSLGDPAGGISWVGGEE